MFKWGHTGKLKSNFRKHKKYWSSVYNIYALFKEIEKYGDICNKTVYKENREAVDFDDFSKDTLRHLLATYPTEEFYALIENFIQRDGSYLSFYGNSRIFDIKK